MGCFKSKLNFDTDVAIINSDNTDFTDDLIKYVYFKIDTTVNEYLPQIKLKIQNLRKTDEIQLCLKVILVIDKLDPNDKNKIILDRIISKLVDDKEFDDLYFFRDEECTLK